MSFLYRWLLLSCCGGLVGCASQADPANWASAIKQHRWELVNWPQHTIANGDNGQPIILSFQADPSTANQGRVSGFSGCNHFSAVYQIDQQRLHLGPIMTTKMACPAHNSQFEAQFLASLSQVNHYQLQLPYLTLSQQPTSTHSLRFYQRPTE